MNGRFRFVLSAALAAASLLAAAPSRAVDPADTRMLASPALAADRVAFVYDNDLWVAGREGGAARRVTRAAGRETNPAFSPDGRWLAFSAPYDGNVDVYVMPSGGGEARRLTWHPGNDVVRGWTPDGRVLFSSPREAFNGRLVRLYTVPVEGGPAARVPVPYGFKAALSPDGSRIAYTTSEEAFVQWKRYRGGRAGRIWILRFDDQSVVEVPKPAGGCNDTDPRWSGNALIFNSDRAGEFNLHRFDPATGAVTQLTRLDGFPVLDPSVGPDGAIAFEHGGWIHRLDPGAAEPVRLRIAVSSDLPETRPRLASGGNWVRGASPSPDAKRVALEFRGEIVTVPAEKGDPRVLTASPGAHDRSPAWSPDGRRIAWFSDQGGEYALWIGPQDGRGAAKRYALPGAGFYDEPAWSPDGARIAFRDNSQSVWVFEVASGAATRIAQEPVYSPLNLLSVNWSPDSRWLAYTLQDHGMMRAVHVWSVEHRRSFRVTDGLSEMSDPVFDPNGEYLYVLASTDAGPLKDWFSQISTDMQMKYGVYAVTLRRDGPNPLAPRSDEAAPKGEPGAAGKAPAKEPPARPPVVRIDFERIGDRIVALPVGTGTRRGLAVGASGEIYWLETVGRTAFDAWEGPAELKRFTLEKRETKTIARDVDRFQLAAEGKKVLYRVKDGLFLADAGDELPPGKGALALDRVSVRVEPRAEWAQIFDEAWRLQRDWFYDPGMHGADWPAVREKYRAFLPHLATRHDLDRVLRWMLSELAVGHSYLSPGEYPETPKKVAIGLLGADLAVEHGRWRFTKVFGGLNWNPDLRAPLRTPGVDVRDGEYLLAVEGRDLRPPADPYAPFENAVDRQVRITVGPSPDGRGAREVVVVPVASETNLRYLDWVESNLRLVDERTGGRVAYVHLPNTAEEGHAMFKRYFYPQSHKEAIILDERYNGGGLVADYYIDIMRRPFLSYWAMRYGADLVTPRGAIFGPKVMIADEFAGSGGDFLPWMFKKLGLGPVVGKRTWGGLVGILGFPVLVDGGSVTAPNLAIWTEDGWIVENEGVAPDVEVEQWPKDLNAGRDPQLEKAIELVMEALRSNPPKRPVRPPFPKRAR
uniref:Tricorn protease homolog n=1 Tax=Eiseniibacteriota bacterium TaxID=2212470 RepID=A0A832I0M1_UNCEI